MALRNMKQTFRQTRRADRDAIEQLNAVLDAIREHEAELAPCLPAIGWTDNSDDSQSGHIQLFVREAMVSRLDEAKRSGERVMQTEISKALALGETRRLANAPTSAALKLLVRDFPHFVEVLDLIQQRASLARITPGQVFFLPPLLLSGPPGIGKTAFAESLAACLQQPMKRVDVAAATASFALAGSHESWATARHGAIWSLLQAPSASGVLLLDEIDKAGGGKYPILGPLYSLLEPVSAQHFQDEYMQVAVNASHLLVIATCNDADLMESALRSRFRVVNVPLPNKGQMSAIAGSVYRRLRAGRPWGSVFPSELPMAIIERLTDFTPRELSRLIEEALGRAASAGRLHLIADDIDAVATSAKNKPKIGFV